MKTVPVSRALRTAFAASPHRGARLCAMTYADGIRLGARSRVVDAKPCSLQYTLGRTERCPESSRCPFWEGGGAVLEAGCLLERFLPPDDWTPELAHRWLTLRRSLERSGGAEAGTRNLFYRLSR